MVQQLIEESKEQFALDYKDESHLDERLESFEEGMITAFRIMFEQSLRSSISFDIVLGESKIHF